MSVLIVHDYGMVREALSTWLARRGIGAVTAVGDAEAAAGLARREALNLVIIGVTHDLDGAAVARRPRAGGYRGRIALMPIPDLAEQARRAAEAAGEAVLDDQADGATLVDHIRALLMSGPH